MNINTTSRNRFIRLYNPEKEGLGSYDVNYVNAYKKIYRDKNEKNYKSNEASAAWFHSLEVLRN